MPARPISYKFISVIKCRFVGGKVQCSPPIDLKEFKYYIYLKLWIWRFWWNFIRMKTRRLLWCCCYGWPSKKHCRFIAFIFYCIKTQEKYIFRCGRRNLYVENFNGQMDGPIRWRMWLSTDEKLFMSFVFYGKINWLLASEDLKNV